MLQAARADGTSLFTQTVRFLQQGGAGIDWDSDGLHVTGTSHLDGTRFTVTGGRIEAATMLAAMAATRSRIHLDGISYDALLLGLRGVLTAAGITLTSNGHDSLTAAADAMDAVQTATGPRPDLPTDTSPPCSRRHAGPQ
jgi:UDP-N-acetylglucosamine enolpyruvyl transferase